MGKETEMEAQKEEQGEHRETRPDASLPREARLGESRTGRGGRRKQPRKMDSLGGTHTHTHTHTHTKHFHLESCLFPSIVNGNSWRDPERK